jgi:phosphatidylglycerophosphate synthase
MSANPIATTDPSRNFDFSKSGFRNASRIQLALTARHERTALIWLAQRTPAFINADHLSVLGFAAQFLAGVSYALAHRNKLALLGVNFFIVLNWLGDSLDGTLARLRRQLRPRYGFYVDHMSDTFGAVFLMTGLSLSGYVHWQVALGMLIAFLVLSVETYLATYAIGEFRLSHGPFGPTEIRILLVLGNFVLLFHPHVRWFRREFLLFDVGGVIAISGMMLMAFGGALRHTAQLYREEPRS